MRRWVLPIRQEDRQIFELLASGEKTVETRAGGKYDAIKAGDTVIYTCGSDKLERQITAVRKFAGIDELLAEIPVAKIMPWVKSQAEAAQVYYGFPGYRERIAEHGIVAFEMKG